MIDVLFTHSYFLHFDPKEERAMMPYPPLGTLYAASMLRSTGYTVALHDVMLTRSEEEIIPRLRQLKPAVVVIYDDCFNYLTKMCLSRMREAAFKLTRLAKLHGCRVIVFSSDATDHAAEYLEHEADVVLCGEGEVTLLELMDHLTGRSVQELKNIPGLAFRSQGTVVKTAPRTLQKDLDRLPFPAWDLVNLEQYRSAWLRNHGYFSLNMVTTRGCPFHCNWCAKPIYGQVYHSRSPENVVDEMLHLKKTAHPDHLWFADDIFGLKPGWIKRFGQLVNERHAHISFKCLSRVDLLLQEDTIRHLKSAGCQTVWIGAESGSQKILDAMEKGTRVEQIYSATLLLKEAGIRVGFFLQFGYPGETKQDIEKTLNMVKECAPAEIGVSVSYPLPGTKFYERVSNQLAEKKNWVDSGDLDLMFQGTYRREYYRILHRVVHKKFSIWRGATSAVHFLHNPTQMKTRIVRSVAAMLYHGLTLPFELRKLRSLERTPQIP